VKLGEAARSAAHDDLPRLAELTRLLAQELAAMRGGPLWTERERRIDSDALDAILDDDRHRLVAGTVDEVIVGYGVARVETLDGGRLHGVIDELFVEPEARGIGVGEAVLEELLAFLRDCNCHTFDALALPGHRAAKNFFEEAGFTARLLVMHRSE
jgi:GNAT superfamily N-acetyltransferase